MSDVVVYEGKLSCNPGNLSTEDQSRYGGQYVCVPSFQDNTVVSAHSDAMVAHHRAKEKGHPDPVCFYVPSPGERFAFLETSEAITIR